MDEAYRLTPEGYSTVLNVFAEFCRGFTIEEIAANGKLSADEIKVSILVLMESYADMAGFAVVPNDVE